MKHYFFTIAISLVAVFSAQAQSKLSKFSIFGGIAFGQEDRRLFNLPLPRQKEYLEARERLDRTYSIGVMMDVFSYKRFVTTAGIGYMAQNTRFNRPFEAGYFLNGAQPLILIQRYTISQITLPLATTFYLDKNKRLGITGNYINNIAFRRSINNRFSDWKMFYKSFEVYPGLVFRLNKHFILDASYRVFYYNKFDILTIGTAMRWGYEDIRFERYNPRTVMLRLRYQL